MCGMKLSSMSDATSDTESEEGFPPEIEQDIPGECTFCRKILYVAEKHVSEIRDHIDLEIGHIDKISSSDCNCHKPLLEAFAESLKLEEKNGVLSIFRDYFSSSFSFSHRSDTAKPGHFYGHTPSLDLLGSSGLGVQVNPSWVDEEVASRWYEDCITSHGEKCFSPRYLELLPPSKPEYFIDTTDNCLVPAPANAPYAALSYVWGQIKMLSTTNSNLIDLQRPGAFQHPGVLKALPRTVRHAMHLTRKLRGLRYIWVDALCIVQDDEQMMNRHLLQMGSIYAHASIVITSIDGMDADYGLHGLRDAPEPRTRHIKQFTIPFGDRVLVRRHDMGPNRSACDPPRPYLDRGWTFQEHFFSRRSLCFENDSIWFQCCSSTSYEDHDKTQIPDSTRDWILDVGYPSVTVFSRVVAKFHRRQLTFPQDCLLAFAGTVPCYTKIFTNGFVCGLPEMFIDAALLWQPGGDLVRRVPFYNSNKAALGIDDPSLPSWSWSGWQGVLDFAGWDSANDFIAACSGRIALTRCQIVSTTTWYSLSTRRGSDRRKIDCLWTESRERYKDPSKKLPKGWTKRLKKKGELLTCQTPPEGYGKYVYHCKGSRNTQFWYPLPLGDSTAVPRTDANAAYLYSEVQTASAYTLGDVSTTKNRSSGSDEGHPYVSLANADGNWIGILRLHSADYFEKIRVDLGEGRLEVQLIAISEGFVLNGLDWGYLYVDEYEMKERPTVGPKYEFVNVLWISWDGGVARREALGRVAKVHWAGLGAKPLNVVLE